MAPVLGALTLASARFPNITLLSGACDSPNFSHE